MITIIKVQPMWLLENFSENKTLILYMFLTDYVYNKLCMYTKYSEYYSKVTISSVCIITYRLIYM